MVKVSSGELQRRIGPIQDLALMDPVTITHNGRDRLVMMSIEEFRRLKRRDREVLRPEDFGEADLKAIREAEPPAEAAAFDSEVTG
ncbi:MAG: type II toxin-antitoxin system Phd/YefM family antitoxin [Isosphaeraceae bacterium]